MKIKLPEYITRFSNKYKYILPVCAIGVLLILLPAEKNESAEKDTSIDEELFLFDATETEKNLSELFSKIDGVGKAEVKLTVKAGFEKEYVSDKKESAETGNGNTDTDSEISLVKISEGNREKPLLKRINYPEFNGAVIVCEGGDDSRIKFQLTQAVKSLTGISSDNIVVAKMKK